MSDSPIKLDLQQTPYAAALPLLDRLLDLIASALPDPDDAEAKTLLQTRVANYREALTHGDLGRIHQRGQALLDTCTQVVDTHHKLRSARRAEIIDLVALLRDVTASVTGDGSAMTREMAASAARFAALDQVNDIRLLKDRLAREAAKLKETAAVRDQQWQLVVAGFQDKIEGLEHQLIASRQEATLDPLTGLANRRLFDATLLTLTKDSSRRFGLVFIDVDDFKRVNDQGGHDAGDRVLKTIAHGLASSVRSDDVAARIGGDEFALVLENVTLDQAVRRIMSIAASIAAQGLETGTSKIGLSCGVAEFSAGDTPASLCRRADEALYEAKRTGKNRVVKKAAPFVRDLREMKTPQRR